jgi:hypothetical protein
LQKLHKPTGSITLSEITELEETPGRFKAKRIDRGGLLCANHTRPLNSLKAVVSEQARVYRAMVNSVITLNEGVKLVFVLREIRSSLEALNAETAAAIAYAPKPAPPAVKINILTVPSGTYVDQATMQRMSENADTFPQRQLLEHMEPTSEPAASSLEPPAEAETVEAIIPRSSEEARFIAELSALSYDALLERAQRAGVLDVAAE